MAQDATYISVKLSGAEERAVVCVCRQEEGAARNKGTAFKHVDADSLPGPSPRTEHPDCLL